MYIVFKGTDEWFEKHPQLKEKFKKTYKTIYEAAHEYAVHMDELVKDRTNDSLEIEISENLLKQTLIDAFDDLLRLTNYHPTDKPNPIKEMSYIVFWLVHRKPIRLVSEDIIKNDKLTDIARTRLLFINEEFGVKLLINSIFTGKQENGMFSSVKDEAQKQLKYYKRFLLYYLIYRLDSPKALEAMALGCTIYPIWNVNPVIWDNPEDTEHDF